MVFNCVSIRIGGNNTHMRRIAGDSTIKMLVGLSGQKALESAVNQPLGICDIGLVVFYFDIKF